MALTAWTAHPHMWLYRQEKEKGYSIFDSALYRNLKAKWLFPQEKAALHDLKMSTSESKML